MDIFNISDAGKFQTEALKIFRHQAKNSKVYKQFLDLLKIDPFSIVKLEDIPFIPVDFFKSHQILSTDHQVERIFSSSGTTGSIQSQHFVTDLNLYEESFSKGFEHFYGNVKDYTILALLPGYLERQGSSLIYMVDHLIKQSNSKDSGFYLNELDALSVLLTKLDSKGEKVILIGVTYALLDLIKDRKFNLKNTIVMETGGMKGKRKELIRSELHGILSDGFGGVNIHSEYGMTELLSQAY
ncbi:acyl transferase, partial [Lutimonas sp.]|uniref:LuxE/PaaK family acyltransferase n=1 Tax=Lutimonas sp. TaxID=1872403 RepID=UPI003C769716